MNKPIDPRDLQPFRVTTGQLPASRKLYSPAPGFPDVMVPYREIALHPTAKEPPIRVYDTTGPYTDPTVQIDVHEGLPKVRAPWIAARADTESYAARHVKPEDNGHVTGDKLVTQFPHLTTPLRAKPGARLTQYQYAKAGIITATQASNEGTTPQVKWMRGALGVIKALRKPTPQWMPPKNDTITAP